MPGLPESVNGTPSAAADTTWQGWEPQRDRTSSGPLNSFELGIAEELISLGLSGAEENSLLRDQRNILRRYRAQRGLVRSPRPPTPVTASAPFPTTSSLARTAETGRQSDHLGQGLARARRTLLSNSEQMLLATVMAAFALVLTSCLGF